ncbi:transposase [Streptomyces rubradiris]|uniref:transposase n=1 Tax=Streptomyces rubradiris TaxID=285531 RepID=UPI0033F0BB03
MRGPEVVADRRGSARPHGALDRPRGQQPARPGLAQRRGRSRLDDRRILNGIVWKFRAGVAWWDVPERYGSWATLHTYFPPLGQGRHLHPHAPGRPGEHRRGRRHRLAGVGGLRHRVRPPARGRGPKRGGTAARGSGGPDRHTVSPIAAATAPVPRDVPVLGSLGSLRRNTAEFLLGLQRDHGEVVRMRLGPLIAIRPPVWKPGAACWGR